MNLNSYNTGAMMKIHTKVTGLLPRHLKITSAETIYRPELELLRLVDKKCVELGLTREEFEDIYGLSATVMTHYRSGKKSLRHADDEVIATLADIADVPRETAFGLVGRNY